MKRLIFLTLLLLCASPAQSQDSAWVSLKTQITANINGIYAVTPDTILVVTKDGRLGRTFNSGKSWDLLKVDTTVQLEDLYFVNSDVGLVCGSSGAVYLTSDGGYTWERTSGNQPGLWFFDIELFDGVHGLVVGLNRSAENPMTGVAFRTADGGRRWKEIELPGIGFSEIYYRPNNPVFVLAYGQLDYSTDMGLTWSSARTNAGAPARTVSLWKNRGVVAGMRGLIAQTTDGGKTWQRQDFNEEAVFVTAEFVDDSTIYLGGIPGLLVKTTGNGADWTPQELPGTFDILDLCLAGNRLWAVGTHGGIMYKTVR